MEGNNRILTELPRYEEGSCKGKVNRPAMVGMELKLLYEDEVYEVKVLEYIKGSSPRFVVEYNGQTHNIICGDFINGNYGGVLGVHTKDFKVNIGDVFKDSKRDIVIIDREYRERKYTNGRYINYKWYKYRCNKCGWDEGWIVESSLLSGIGCSCCAGRTAVLGINTIWDTDRWLCTDYGLDENFARTHTMGSGEKADFTCVHCGRLKEIAPRTVRKEKSIGCICSGGFSYGHKYIYNILKQNNIDFQSNVTFDWCRFKDYKEDKIRSGEYDFVIEGIKTIIEVDGGFHRKYNKMSGQTKEESQYIDKMKDRLAREHGYEVIRIYYDDKKVEIKKYILNSEVPNVIDISNTNWLKCEEFALSNLVKEVCLYWNNNRQEWETTKTLAEVFGLSRDAITDYLKKGAELGWCKYDAKEEMIKTAKLNGKSSGKRVAMYDLNGSFIAEYPSTKELARSFFAETGIKLDDRGISAVARGERKHHKGYTFKYIED